MRARSGWGTNALLTVGWVSTGLATVTSGVAMARGGWAPLADDGLIAAMTVDSLSMDPPLVGMPTSLGFEDGRPLSHVGPLGFWALAIPTRIMGEPGHGLILGAVLVTLASITGIGVLLRRHRDIRLEALALLVVAAMVASVGGAILADPFNPYIGVLPTLLCMIATWSVVSGKHSTLWMMVLAGSFAAQVHLSYVPLVAAMGVVVALSLSVDVARCTGAARRRLTHRIIPVGLLVGLAAWVGPTLDLVAGSENLPRLVSSQSGGRPARGMGHAAEIAVEMTAIPPRWVLGRARDEVFNTPSAWRMAASGIAVIAVLLLGLWAARTHNRSLASLSLVSLVSVVVATLTSAREANLDAESFSSDGLLVYRLFWWPVGAVFTLALAWGLVSLVSARQATVAEDRRPARAWRLAAQCLAVAALLICPLGHRTPPDGSRELWSGPIPHARAIAGLPGSADGVVLRFWPDGDPAPVDTIPEYGYSTSLLAQLRLRGIPVRFPDDGPEEGSYVLSYRNEHRARGDERVVILYRVGPDVDLDPPPGYRRISRSGPAPGQPLNPYDPPTAVYVRS